MLLPQLLLNLPSFPAVSPLSNTLIYKLQRKEERAATVYLEKEYGNLIKEDSLVLFYPLTQALFR